MAAPAVVVLSEGFCPLCHGHLGDRADPRVSLRFCTVCSRYWRLERGQAVGSRGGGYSVVFTGTGYAGEWIDQDEVWL
jgi:hypothetical protein